MTYFRLTFFLFVSIEFFSSCHPTHSGPPVLDRHQYMYNGPSRCDTIRNSGVNVVVSYFLLKDDADGTRAINDTLQYLAVSSIANWLDSSTVAANPDTRTDLPKTANLFATDYEAMRKDIGSLGGCWELKTTADTLYAGPKMLTVEFNTFAYTGGAHPNTNLSFYTFDRTTGHRITIADMVSDTTTLLGMVERAFRKQQDIQPNTNLEDHGYFLRDGRFFLPANVGMSQEGLVFYYNPYEIAAYVIGPIQLTIPYTQLSGILRKNLID